MTPLPPGQQLVAAGKWPVIGERSPAATIDPWRLDIGGLVARPVALDLDGLRGLPPTEATIDIHCVTRWSKLAVRFRGVLLSDVLPLAEPAARARFVSFVAHSDRGHDTSLPLDAALSLATLLAWEADGEPISMVHGGPVRVIVPGRYFYKSLKWLARIELLESDRLGFWERTAGYHNEADPWRQQRYVAAGLSKADVAQVLATRRADDRELRGLQVAGHNLSGLIATRATLRDADFRGCVLGGADFAGANLSNAHFERADLRQASFRGADVEGANFAGADLRGADFTGASLIGTTFCVAGDAAEVDIARFDAATRFEPAALTDLTPDQFTLVVQRLRRGES